LKSNNPPPLKVVGSANQPRQRSLLDFFKIFLLVICLPIALAAFITFVIIPHQDKNKASQKLQSLVANEGSVAGYNSTSIGYQGAKIKGASQDQRALALGGKMSAPGEFVFTNGKQVSNNSNNTLSVYIDFSTRQGQEFSLIEQNYLKALVSFGQAKLIIYAVPSSSSYSIYAPEVLAQAFASKPADAWKVFKSVMELSTELTNHPQSNSKTVNQLAKLSQGDGVTSITRSSILRGQYSSWILAASHSKAVEGASLPLVSLNGRTINITPHSFYAQNGLEKYVQAHLR
jgi:hypothetical protein